MGSGPPLRSTRLFIPGTAPALAALETLDHSHLCPTFLSCAKPILATTQVWGHQFSLFCIELGKERGEKWRHGKVRCLRQGHMAHQWQSWHCTQERLFSTPVLKHPDHPAASKTTPPLWNVWKFTGIFPDFYRDLFLLLLLLFHTWLTAVCQKSNCWGVSVSLKLHKQTVGQKPSVHHSCGGGFGLAVVGWKGETQAESQSQPPALPGWDSKPHSPLQASPLCPITWHEMHYGARLISGPPQQCCSILPLQTLFSFRIKE